MADLYVGDDIYVGGEDDELEGVFAGDYDDDDDDEVADDEIIGLDEIIGAFMEEMGATKRRPRRRRRRPAKSSKGRNLLQLLALAKAAGGAGTRKKSRNNVFEQPLPIPPTSFTTGQALDIELRPQRLFRTERLVIDSAIATFFRILDLKIGQTTQFVASGALPATIFSEVAVGVRLRGDTANLGNTIVLSAQNIDANTRVLSGAIVGTVID